GGGSAGFGGASTGAANSVAAGTTGGGAVGFGSVGRSPRPKPAPPDPPPPKPRGFCGAGRPRTPSTASWVSSGELPLLGTTLRLSIGVVPRATGPPDGAACRPFWPASR